jgi:gliding motility-associated-like protein
LFFFAFQTNGYLYMNLRYALLMAFLISFGLSYAQTQPVIPQFNCEIEGSQGDICEGEEVVLEATFQNPINYSFFPDRQHFATVADHPLLRFSGQTFTLEFWIRVVDQAATFQTILAKVTNFTDFNGYAVGYLDNNIVASYGDGTGNVVTIQGNTNIRDNAWHHVAVVFDVLSNMILYVDGSIDAQASILGVNAINPVEPLCVGATFVGGQAISFFEGRIDEIRLWDERRTPAQLQNRRFNHFNPSGVTGLVAYWDFNEGAGDRFGDCGPNGFTGIMSTATGWSTNAPSLSWTIPVRWSDGTGIYTNIFRPTDTTYLMVELGYCKYICVDSIQINVIDCAGGISDITKLSLIWVPNAFTPNDDTKNDEWRVRGNNIFDYHIAIFNRMGNKIYESRDIDKAWDGTSPNGQVHEGIYTYVIRYLDINNERQTKYGTILLMK